MTTCVPRVRSASLPARHRGRPKWNALQALLLLAGTALLTARAFACTPALKSFAGPEAIPAPVVERFCQPETGYDSLLLIRAALDPAEPVYRVIAVKNSGGLAFQGVRLYQFDGNGRALPAFFGQPQAVIDFEGSPPRFKAQIKGLAASASFEKHNFEFAMGGLFGTEITQRLDAEGGLSFGNNSTSILLLRTRDQKNWRWVTDDGQRVPFD